MVAIEAHNRSFLIDYKSEDFPAQRGIRSFGQLRLTWDDILWAAVTVGRPKLYYVFRHGEASLFEAIFRWSLIRMALEQRGCNLYRTDAFKSLDPTEKGAVNYFLGMVFCKLFADQLLGAPWLLHLDVFRDHLNVSFQTGRSRPDLVGHETGTGEWHAFESKGRASVPGLDEKDKAKKQAQRIVSVHGKSSQLHIGAITYFKGDVLHFYWRDPHPDEPKHLNPIELKLPDEAWGAYYEPVSEFLREAGEPATVTDGTPAMAMVEQANVAVGAHPKILPLLLEQKWQMAHDVSRDLASDFHEKGYRPDGLIVKSSESWQQPFDGRQSE